MYYIIIIVIIIIIIVSMFYAFSAPEVLFSFSILPCLSKISSRLLSKNLKIKIYKTIILPAVLYGCETWSHTLR